MINGARLGWLLLPQKRTVEVWTAAETANSPLVLNDPSRLEAGLEFPGLVIDPRRIWEVLGRRPGPRRLDFFRLFMPYLLPNLPAVFGSSR